MRFIGHPDGCDLELPCGGMTRVAYKQAIEVDEDFGRSLLTQTDNWELAPDDHVDPELPPVELVTPAEVFRRMLRQLRQQSEWTLLQLAVRVQVVGGKMTTARLSDLENGTAKRGVTLDELCSIAYAINVAPSRLLEGASLPGPLDVAVTQTKTMTQRGFRDWYRGRRAHRTDEPVYLTRISDDDYLQLQRTTVKLLDHDYAALVDAAQSYRDDPADSNWQALDNAIGQIAERRRTLEQSHDNFPSERPRRQERRGRPRQRDRSPAKGKASASE